jgi:hypothetical protein
MGLGGLAIEFMSEPGKPTSLAMWMVAGLIIFVFCVDLCVVLFNKPAFLVPHSLRAEPGVLSRRSRARRENPPST